MAAELQMLPSGQGWLTSLIKHCGRPCITAVDVVFAL